MKRSRLHKHVERRARLTRRALIDQTVEQNAHKSMFVAKNSCDEITLRVKRDPLLNRSIGLPERTNAHSSKHSTTELTTEPHSRKAHWQISAEDTAPEHSGTPESCGFSSFSKTPDHPSAGFTPALFPRAPSARFSRVRRAEFISVSGQCAARSAHFSDLRNHKRISGGVAATEHLHAPMNSPTGSALSHTWVAQRVSFSTSALTCIEGDSSWL